MDMDLGSPDLNIDLNHDVNCDFGGDNCLSTGMETDIGHVDFSGGVDVNGSHNHDNNCDSIDVHGHLNDGDGTNISGGGHYDNCDGNHNQFDVDVNHNFNDNSSINFGHSEGPNGGETHFGFKINFD